MKNIGTENARASAKKDARSKKRDEVKRPPSDEQPAVWLRCDELHAWPDNPRHIDAAAVERVAKSIERFGFSAPIVARAANREIIAGETRWHAAKKLELARVPVRLVAVSAREAHLLAVVDNHYTEMTPWDDTKLQAELAKYEPSEVDFAGWDEAQFAALTERVLGSSVIAAEPLDDDDASGAAAPEDAAADARVSFDVFSVDQVTTTQARCILGTSCADDAPTAGDAMVELNRCAAGAPRCRVQITDKWFPHRYDVLAGHSPQTPNQTLQDLDVLEHCIRLMADGPFAGSATRARVLATLSIFRGRQAARQFPVPIARDIYRQYSELGARVLDPCAGWGGRLLGWACSLQKGAYVGYDASSRTVDSFERMIAELGLVNCSVAHAAFEDVSIEPESYDFAFTSPPYFDCEQYSDDAEQSCKRYATYGAWREGFLRPLVLNTLRALKPGCRFVLNVSEAGEHPIPADVVALAEAAGATVESQTKLDVGAGSGGGMQMKDSISEDLIVLQKKG